MALHTALGVDYLYPDQKYSIRVNTPGTVNVNLLLLKVDDYDKIQTVKPVWDAVKKTWVYDGIAPLIQINDITTTQEKTITIKNQGKYFLCADDRKETGVSDTIYHVPVKITRL
jgi:predicted  nucleic acid-binding Zn-ribbon protein